VFRRAAKAIVIFVRIEPFLAFDFDGTASRNQILLTGEFNA
jgi:hypothetical protein